MWRKEELTEVSEGVSVAPAMEVPFSKGSGPPISNGSGPPFSNGSGPQSTALATSCTARDTCATAAEIEASDCDNSTREARNSEFSCRNLITSSLLSLLLFWYTPSSLLQQSTTSRGRPTKRQDEVFPLFRLEIAWTGNGEMASILPVANPSIVPHSLTQDRLLITISSLKASDKEEDSSMGLMIAAIAAVGMLRKLQRRWRRMGKEWTAFVFGDGILV